MSSSQQQSTNSNNNPPPNPQFNDYEADPSLPLFPNWNFPLQSSDLNTGGYFYPPGQGYIDNRYVYPEYIDDGDDIPSELEAELNAREEMMRNEQLVDNNEDEAIYDDDVQNAFANYENEYSKLWNQNEPSWSNFSNDEQEEMFEQMRECMNYMSEEYSAANMSDNRTDSQLNPDAKEFQPSWTSSSTTTDINSTVDTSTISSEVKRQKEE